MIEIIEKPVPKVTYKCCVAHRHTHRTAQLLKAMTTEVVCNNRLKAPRPQWGHPFTAGYETIELNVTCKPM